MEQEEKKQSEQPKKEQKQPKKAWEELAEFEKKHMSLILKAKLDVSFDQIKKRLEVAEKQQ